MRRMTAREWQEWQVYATLWPFGERAADLRAGTIAATLINVQPHDPAKARPPVYDATDVFPWLAGEPVEETPEETYARMVAGLTAGGHQIVKAEA